MTSEIILEKGTKKEKGYSHSVYKKHDIKTAQYFSIVSMHYSKRQTEIPHQAMVQTFFNSTIAVTLHIHLAIHLAGANKLCANKLCDLL